MTANSTIFMGLWFGISQVSKSGDCLIKKKQFLRGACAAKGSSDCSWTGLYIYTYYMSQSGIWRDISRAGGHIFTSRRSLRVKCLAYSTLTSVINCLSYA